MPSRSAVVDRAVEYAWIGDRLVGLPVAVLACLPVYAAYVITHPSPHGGGGLFTAMAQQIVANGYLLPDHIPHYTASGIPFGYPPLGPYLLAALFDLGASPLVVVTYLPSIYMLLCLVPVYYIGRELFASEVEATVATIIFGVSPDILHLHLKGGGVVRTLALLFTLLGAYTGLKVFEDGGHRWIVAAVLLFAATVLTHPVTTLFFILTYVVLYLAYDRTLHGLLVAAGIGVGGLAVAGIWWVPVSLTHGFDLFLDAAGSRAIAEPLRAVGGVTLLIPPRTELLTLWQVFLLVGLPVLLVRERILLPFWFVATASILHLPRFVMVPGAFVAAVGVVTAADAITDQAVDLDLGTVVAAAFVVFVVGFGIGSGALYATGYPLIGTSDKVNNDGIGSSGDVTVSPADLEAMEWARQNTEPDANFAVEGAVADWFPVYANRTAATVPFGAEWLGSERHGQLAAVHAQLDACLHADCLESVVAASPDRIDYLYLENTRQRRAAIRSSSAFEIVFRNDHVIVVAVDRPSNG